MTDNIKLNKIRHIMKRLTDIVRVFNGEIDALEVELTELLTEEQNHGCTDVNVKSDGMDTNSTGSGRSLRLDCNKNPQ